MDTVVGKDRLGDESDQTCRTRQWPRRRCVCTQRPLVVKWSLEQCKESGYDIPVGAAVFMNVSRSATKQLEFRHEEVPGGGHERRDAGVRAAVPHDVVLV